MYINDSKIVSDALMGLCVPPITAFIVYVMTPLYLYRYCPLWGLIPLMVLFSPKAHSSGGKGLYTLK